MAREHTILGAIFLASLCGFLLAGLPAATVLAPLRAIDAEAERPIITRIRGVWWDGSVQGNWQGHRFLGRWTLQRRGLTPGLRLSVEAGDFHASGWAGGGWRGWRLEQWLVTLPVLLVEDLLPDIRAEGMVEIRINALTRRDNAVERADGALRYGGGKVSWGELDPVSVPPLDGVLSLVETYPEFSMTGPGGETLLRARLEQQAVSLRAYGALPQLFGLTEDGDPEGEIFHSSYAFPL
ncbi:type II secretion system protein N [Isoalcanivorax indicus]|uniref:type II secretion system protein N n=1 Tax=Isoalcanivorax indicus TaxID=2202653 RepID=UPI000DB9DC6B|nr:type II secretion system protein N [Isoalcanivorax indicus]